MSENQGKEVQPSPAVAVPRKPAGTAPEALVVGRASQPMGYRDANTARVPGFEDVTDQPDWGGDGFSGRKSDVRLVRFDRQPAPQPEGEGGPVAGG
jgi:hypothetical protein